MFDEVIDALHPYDGSEESPYTWLRVGRVTKVYASSNDVQDTDSADRRVGTVDLEWLDRQTPSNQIVAWSYSAFSNPLIAKVEATTSKTNVSVPTTQISTGSSCGIFYVPSVGDVVVCGFRSPNHPVIIGYLPHNLNKQLMTTDEKAKGKLQSFGPFRTLKSGEFSIKAQQQNEVYLDRAGTIQLVVMSQTLETPAASKPPIDTTVVPTTELGRISLGVTYDPTFKTTVKSAYGKDVICNISLSSGARIQIDSTGNLDIQSKGKYNVQAPSDMNLQTSTGLHLGGTTGVNLGSGTVMAMGGPTMLLSAPNGMTMQANLITMNAGTKGAARLDDSTLTNNTTDSTYWTWFSNFISAFNSWSPVPNDGGAALKSLLANYVTAPPTSITGKISSASGTTKIGD